MFWAVKGRAEIIIINRLWGVYFQGVSGERRGYGVGYYESKSEGERVVLVPELIVADVQCPAECSRGVITLNSTTTSSSTD